MQDFLDFVRKELTQAGFTLELVDSDKVTVPDSDVTCSGFFDHDLKLARVAIRRPTDIWLGVLVHEFNHFLQFMENDPIFTGCYVNGKDACTVMDEWFDGKIELTQEELKEVFDKVKYMELDCEKRSYEMIERWALPVDSAFYIKMSNAYVLSHNLMRERRQFIKQIASVPEVVNMPAYFLEDYDTNEYNSILELLFK